MKDFTELTEEEIKKGCKKFCETVGLSKDKVAHYYDIYQVIIVEQIEAKRVKAKRENNGKGAS